MSTNSYRQKSFCSCLDKGVAFLYDQYITPASQICADETTSKVKKKS